MTTSMTPTPEQYRDYLRWIANTCLDYGALLVVWVNPDGSEQPVLMPGEAFEWWADKARLEN